MSRRRFIAVAGVAALLVLGKTSLDLKPLPDSLPPSEFGLGQPQITDRNGLPLTVSYQADWNRNEVVPDVSRGPWKKNGALHSVIRVSYQAATSACSRTSLRRW